MKYIGYQIVEDKSLKNDISYITNPDKFSEK